MQQKIYYDPANNILYSSFYLVGLWDLFGRKNVKPSPGKFKGLVYDSETHIFAFIIGNTRYAVDFADSNNVFYQDFLNWADVYGKVNYKLEKLPQNSKIIPCSPNFAIPCYGSNKFFALLLAIKNYLLCFKRLNFSFRKFLDRYTSLSKRYTEIGDDRFIDNNKVFFVSRYWSGQEKVNNIRANYIRACKRLHSMGVIEFEGGLVPDWHTIDSSFNDVILNNEIPHKKYIKQLKESFIAFNTPAYFDCHGWKLPEYLSQGKVIISTPFENELPVPLTDGENILFVKDGEEETLFSAIRTLASNKDLKKRLSEGALNYWKKYASPISAIRQLISTPSSKENR